jgi:hypothetical protein
MKKILLTILFTLVLSGSASAKIFILSKCFYTAIENKFDKEVYEKNYYQVDTDQKTIAHIRVITDERLKNSSSKSKTTIDKYDLDYYDNNYAVGLQKKGNKTYKYTLDLKKKIIEVYIIEEKKILTYHKCESNKI